MTATSGPPAAGPDLTGPEADELLRPAAELAIEMARIGARQQPPLDPPSRLRPLLSHAKVTKRALATARRVIEEEPEFRARVAMAVETPGAEETLGRAGLLWLSRPEGWEAELGRLVAEARTEAMARAESAEERSAQRRLAHAEGARARAERATEEARRAAEGARLELQEERRQRRAGEDAAAKAARHAAALEEQLAAARRAIEATATELTQRAEAEAELATLRAEVVELRRALAERAAPEAVAAPAEGAGPEASALTVVERQALRQAVAEASAAAAALGAALGRAAGALEPPGPGADEPSVEADPGAAPRTASRRATRPRWDRRRTRGTRRRPAPLPPLVRDDSAEAADHLVSLPNVSLLVDGYNATLSTWPDLPLPEQRLRLVDALVELAARTGARPEVVFDGADVATDHTVTRTVRSLVRVSFTAPDVEADDVLIARAHALPLPVVVASNDRRVRDGASAAGANILGIEQLLAALRRKT